MLISVSLTSCGRGGDEIVTPLPETGNAANHGDVPYTAVPFSVPHEIIYGEDVYGNHLYYLADENGQIVISRVDLASPESADVFPLEIPDGYNLFYMSINIADFHLRHSVNKK
jgi:hypothetical protein